LCRRAEKQADCKFCRPCEIAMRAVGPVLVQVPKDNETYNNVANQFQKSWRHATPCPKVQEVYKIVERQETMDNYNAYRDGVEARGGFITKGLTSGNQRRRWHGTNRNCNVGDSGRTSLCYSPQCSLCSIIRTSFDISHFAKKHGGGRWGKGIYTSSTSSVSNAYIKNLVPSPWKAILLSCVVVGNPKTLTQDQSTLTEPPAGFDSVIGNPGTAGSVSEDELIVYTNDAVRPIYLVMYDS